MSQPLVSVIVPVYNGERYIAACIDSILAQTVTDIEVLLVNDGSTDASARILDEQARRDSRLRVIHQQNGGVSQARNAALTAARGRYIRFVDCDDLLPPDSLRILVEKAEHNSSDLVIAAYTEVVGYFRNLKDMNRSERSMPCDEFLADLARRPSSFCYGVLWNKLYRRELIAANHLRFTPHMTWGEDFEFNMQYLVHAQRISYTSAPVYDYIRNPHGLTFGMIGTCVRHPIRSVRLRLQMYRTYVALFRKRGLYDTYRNRLWRFLITFTITN